MSHRNPKRDELLGPLIDHETGELRPDLTAEDVAEALVALIHEINHRIIPPEICGSQHPQSGAICTLAPDHLPAHSWSGYDRKARRMRSMSWGGPPSATGNEEGN